MDKEQMLKAVFGVRDYINLEHAKLYSELRKIKPGIDIEVN